MAKEKLTVFRVQGGRVQTIYKTVRSEREYYEQFCMPERHPWTGEMDYRPDPEIHSAPMVMDGQTWGKDEIAAESERREKAEKDADKSEDKAA